MIDLVLGTQGHANPSPNVLAIARLWVWRTRRNS